MKVAVVGVTGLVGKVMLDVLEKRGFPADELLPVASEGSVGKEVTFRDQTYPIISVADALKGKPDIALFSAGSEVSLEWAPRFEEAGITVIDNSSAWRMDARVPLIVPEVNPASLGDSQIIANPNCSTIQLVLAMWPLHQKFGLKRMVISTYQSVTGTGKAAVDQMKRERLGEQGESPYPWPIDLNCLPHCDVFLGNGYTKEEMKLVNESRKIMGLPELSVTATAVRVPVAGGHSESVNAEFENLSDLSEARKCLESAEGIVVQDNPERNLYPMPLLSEGKDEVFVGRLRMDESQPNTLNMWIVADNLRKGAATNAVQIAELVSAR